MKAGATTDLQWALVTLDREGGMVIKAQVRQVAPPTRGRPGKYAAEGIAGIFHRTDFVRFAPDAEPTPHEVASRELFARTANNDRGRWHIIHTLPAGGGCDFADATEGVPRHESFGQAWRRADGSWGQAPRTKAAVLLRWAGPR